MHSPSAVERIAITSMVAILVVAILLRVKGCIRRIWRAAVLGKALGSVFTIMEAIVIVCGGWSI